MGLDLVIDAVETVADFIDLFVVGVVPLFLDLFVFILDVLDEVGGLVGHSGDHLHFTSVEVVDGIHPGLSLLVI